MSLVNPYPLTDICNIKLHLLWSTINRIFETYNLLFVCCTYCNPICYFAAFLENTYI
jgi:hypothetical protein